MRSKQIFILGLNVVENTTAMCIPIIGLWSEVSTIGDCSSRRDRLRRSTVHWSKSLRIWLQESSFAVGQRQHS